MRELDPLTRVEILFAERRTRAHENGERRAQVVRQRAEERVSQLLDLRLAASLGDLPAQLLREHAGDARHEDHDRERQSILQARDDEDHRGRKEHEIENEDAADGREHGGADAVADRGEKDPEREDENERGRVQDRLADSSQQSADPNDGEARRVDALDRRRERRPTTPRVEPSPTIDLPCATIAHRSSDGVFLNYVVGRASPRERLSGAVRARRAASGAELDRPCDPRCGPRRS